MDFLISVLCLLLAWTLIQALLSNMKTRNRKLQVPPGPLPYPIVGSILQLGDKPHKSLAELAKVHECSDAKVAVDIGRAAFVTSLNLWGDQKRKINRSSHSKRFERNRENMDFMTLVLWLFLSWISIQAFLLATKARNSNHKKPPLPPGPFPYPVVGNLFKLGDKPHKSLTSLAKIYGPIMSLKLGQITTIVISSPTLAKEVLQSNDLCFSYRAPPDSIKAYDHHLHSIIWLPPLNKWRNYRKITNSHIFSAQKLDANQHLRQKKVEEMLQYVQQCSQAGVAVNIGRIAFVTSLNLLSNTMFSVDLVNPSSASAQEFKELVSSIMEEGGTPNLSDYFPVLRYVDPQGIRRRMSDRFAKMFEIFDSFFEQKLLSRKATVSVPTPSIDVLDTLLDLIQQDQDIDRTSILHLFLFEDGVGGLEEMDMDDKFGIALQKSKPLLVVPVKL
ncbi:Cytochrome P450 [Dillenia turbinata]|uniref:Cytochrome P450 n=1 Tax=Dillenia turbinata TaxID=194707 RepID=A0AAN8UVM1_9MAGN